MKRFRIAVAVDFLPDEGHPHRGRANYQRVRNLARFAEVQAYRLQPAYPSLRKLNESHATGGNAEVLLYQSVPVISRAMNGRAAGRALAARLREFRPDAILAYFVYPIGFAAVAAGRELGVPAVVGAVGSDLRRMNGIFVRPLITQAIRNAAFVTTVSEELRRRAIARGAKPERVRTIHDGCDAEIFHPGDRAAARERLQVPADAELVVFVGSMIPLKGIAELLEAAATLAPKRPNLRVVCIGEGAHEGEFRARAAKLGLAERVRFTGGKLPEEVAEWLRAANVFCLPSHSEGTPNVVIEALNCGRAVVATDVGGIPELVTPKCGILAPAKEPRRLAEALTQALDRQWDEEEIARTFRRSWEDWARETYDACLAARSSRTGEGEAG